MEEHLREAIADALNRLDIAEVDFSIEHPAELEHGDYASNVALIAGKERGENPRELAERIVATLTERGIVDVADISVAGPGFINVTLARDFFRVATEQALKSEAKWGQNQSQKGRRYLVEKSAPNLFKPFHIGHLLNITIGEALDRMFRASGADVTAVSYPSDISLGVAKTIWAIQEKGVSDALDVNVLGECYTVGTRAYEDDPKAKEAIDAINRTLNVEQEGEVWEIYQSGRALNLDYFYAITKRLGSSFDDAFYESESGVIGKQIVEAHTPDVFEESEGAVVFKGEKYGLHTRVFITSQGLPVYEAKDIGLLKQKFDAYNPDVSIVITDVEQKQYFDVIKKAASCIDENWGSRSVYWQHGRLRLESGKISSRHGNVPLAEDLINEVKRLALEKVSERKEIKAEEHDALAEMIALGAIKYAFLRQSAGKNITFDPEKSLSFEGDSGPYLQYTHARICSVLRQAEEVGVSGDVAAPEEVYLPERLLYRFPEIVARAQAEYEPHHIVTYLTELAGAFNTFYAQEKIADPADSHAPYKVALAKAVALTLQNGAHMLGFSVPERM